MLDIISTKKNEEQDIWFLNRLFRINRRTNWVTITSNLIIIKFFDAEKLSFIYEEGLL